MRGVTVFLALAGAVTLAGCGSPSGAPAATAPSPSPVATTPTPVPGPALLPRPLVAPGLSLHAGPVAVPLQLQIPSIQVDGPVVAVGLTSANVMSAPEGPLGDPVWEEAFWYRGGGIPGDAGTATIAGHVDDIDGRPALFARLRDLQPGAAILVRDTQNGAAVPFTVTETDVYSVQQASQPAVLARIYGPGPVAGTAAQPAADGVSHLTLVTCTGTFIGGSYNHRVVVYAQRSG
jgi:Sortase domain